MLMRAFSRSRMRPLLSQRVLSCQGLGCVSGERLVAKHRIVEWRELLIRPPCPLLSS